MKNENRRLSRVVIAGGSGFLGQSLASALSDRCDDIVILTRGPARVRGNVRYVQWDAKAVAGWAGELIGAAAVVNLVGRTVDCRKTQANKRVILESRVESVHALAAACRQCHRPPAVWVQAATAHIYGDTGDEVLDESSPTGFGFAPDVGRAWEAALADARLDSRQVILRISFVLGRHGGPLETLARLARLGLGGTVSSGRQYMSWLHEDDLNAIIQQAIDDPAMQGVYIATSPEPATNAVFMAKLRKAVHRPWSPPVPSPLVRLGAWLMRTDPELALLGRRLHPTRLLKEGFVFRHPQLAATLDDLLR